MDIDDTATDQEHKGTLHIMWHLPTVHNVIHRDTQWKTLMFCVLEGRNYTLLQFLRG